jgi:hypothetical protein
MQVFVLDSKQETLKDFNDRIADFFEGHPCASITSEVVGGLLLITALGVDDIPLPQGQIPVVTATVRPLTTEALEQRTNALIEQVQQAVEDPDDAPPIPIDLQIRQRQDKPGSGWIVLVACLGVDVGEDSELAETCPHCGRSLIPEDAEGAEGAEDVGENLPEEDASQKDDQE